MKVLKLTKDSSFLQRSLGGKAYNLQKLIKLGQTVPETYVITARETRNHKENAQISLLLPPAFNKNKTYAVRSSGIGEDGSQNSFAGIFDTILNVRFSAIPSAVKQVYASRDTAITIMYSTAREAKVMDMAIVIQEMVQADYAGVAFSVSPVENDHRIGLIEMVHGQGEALVSGKIRPTSVRINRITGLSRVIQHGADTVPESKLQTIIQSVSDALWNIENHYGWPVDIEWAYSRGKLYLLQARPITSLKESR